MVFQIWPKLNYEAQKEMRNLKKRLRKLKQNFIESQKLAEFHFLFSNIEAIEDNIKRYQSSIDDEVKSNKGIFDLFLGSKVSYGSEIFILHCDSKMFLNGKLICSKTEKSAFSFELSNNFGKGMSFKILPKYKLRQQGEAIQFNDQILIINEKLKCYLEFSLDKVPTADLPLHLKVNDLIPSPNLPWDDSTERFQIFLVQSSEALWKIRLFKEIVPEDLVDDLQGGDLVVLIHTEEQSYLTADHSYDGGKPEIYLRKYEGKFPLEELSAFSIWEIENYFDAREPGGSCHLKSKFRLRHFMSRKNFSECDGKLVLTNYKKDSENCFSNVRFHSTLETENLLYLQDGMSYAIEILLENQMSSHSICSDHEKKYFASQLYENTKLIPTYDPLLDDSLLIKRIGLKFCKNIHDENSFFIERLESDIKSEILLFASSVPTLKKIRDLLVTKTPIGKFLDLCKSGASHLKKIIYFLTDNVVLDGDLIEIDEINLSNRKQMFFRELRILDLIIEILHYSLEENFDLKNLSVLPYEIKLLLTNCYICIKYGIEEYRPNELYASQWITMFINHALNCDPSFDLKAEATLTELIDNNRAVLEKKIDKNTIKIFIHALIKSKKSKLVELLRALVICDEEVMIQNQALVSKEMLHKESIKKSLVWQMSLNSDGEIIVIKPNEESILLKTFQFENGLKEEYQYFITLVSLLSELCINKNFLAIDFLKVEFPFDVCFKVVSDNNFQFDLRSSFCSLIESLWIEGSHIQEVLLPRKTRKWGEVEAENADIIFLPDSMIDQFGKLKNYIGEYIGEVTKDGYQKAFEVKTNSFTLKILKLLKKLLIFGVIQTTNEIVLLLQNLLVLFNGAFDITTVIEEKIAYNPKYKNKSKDS